MCSPPLNTWEDSHCVAAGLSARIYPAVRGRFTQLSSKMKAFVTFN